MIPKFAESSNYLALHRYVAIFVIATLDAQEIRRLAKELFLHRPRLILVAIEAARNRVGELARSLVGVGLAGIH
jgi:hypothetical protein